MERLQRGHFTFTRDEINHVTSGGDATLMALLRLRRQGWVFSPAKGYYIIIDPQHQGSGYLPVEWFIDDWMRFTGCEYYIGLLSAAMLHGAAHHKPQVTQLVRDRRGENLHKGAYRIDSYYKQQIVAGMWEQRKSPAGYYRISTPEMTAYDILRYPRACPSLDLAATIMAELGERIEAERLAQLADLDNETSVLQRLGYLLDTTGWKKVTDSLALRLQQRRSVWLPLRTDAPRDGERNKRWHIIVNADVEVEA
ncbi:MAG: type IV toxin-antitoxin system AbiEi family antitoxin [bacterium]